MHVTIYADGCCRPNPGQASCGAVLHTPSETIEISHYIGEGTSNVAEWLALIVALKQAAEIGATSLDVRMDSRLVVMQASGRWRPKHPMMRELCAEARGLAKRFDRIDYTWIPREENRLADLLASLALGGQSFVRSSPELHPALLTAPFCGDC